MTNPQTITDPKTSRFPRWMIAIVIAIVAVFALNAMTTVSEADAENVAEEFWADMTPAEQDDICFTYFMFGSNDFRGMLSDIVLSEGGSASEAENFANGVTNVVVRECTE